MSNRKIAAWRDAGLIDSATAQRLVAYEAEHARPLALWAVFGLGALAIGLGIISVVAANWEEIPGQLRLAVHLALLIGLSATLALREGELARISPWVSEALLFVIAVLGLTFFGHLGQVYQTSSPLWKPLATWLILFGPMLLIFGRSWPAAALLIGASIYCAWDFAAADSGALFEREERPGWLLAAIATTLPGLFAPFAAWMRDRSGRHDFWRQLELVAITYAVGGATLSCIVASFGGFDSDYDPLGSAGQLVRAVAALGFGLLLVLAKPGLSGRVSGLVMAGSGLTIALALGVNDIDLLAAGLFMALWVGIAAAALAIDARGAFQLAVAVVALRLIILSFELASDLLLSGFGLILSGLMILAVAWGAVRVSQVYAPGRETQEQTP
ncbi:hypothetical protein NAP1_14208 [Erythrobacter sp. NAP1]|uniref:DUF2157 domain-containing protein n=1 Tax=Erythrobacter sp. NAP1 TaxID=237727 RepID=UPI00006878EC|nr:DUF2157 domain-containing protein [Erythrobacter sp. NAP1]EAQ28759.1 hypothetical protein NAP1_14208 [Erythrobacter sp. NAP1]